MNKQKLIDVRWRLPIGTHSTTLTHAPQYQLVFDAPVTDIITQGLHVIIFFSAIINVPSSANL